MGIEATTYDIRLQRKVIKDILAKAPNGLDNAELAKEAELRGLSGEDFQKILDSLLIGGHVYSDKAGRFHFVRNE